MAGSRMGELMYQVLAFATALTALATIGAAITDRDLNPRKRQPFLRFLDTLGAILAGEPRPKGKRLLLPSHDRRRR